MSLQKGLVGHWTMDSRDTDNGVIRDRSGFENHATLSGDGISSRGIINESLSGELFTDKRIKPDTSISFSFWINANPVGNSEDILGTYDFGDSEGIGFARESSGDDVKWSVGSFAGPQADITLNEWDHYVGVFNRNSEELVLYKNASIAGIADNISGFTEANTLQIGTAPNGRFFNGRVDEVRLYERVLSEEEINALYQLRNVQQTSSRGFPVAAGNLVARYPFRDSSLRDEARSNNFADETPYDGFNETQISFEPNSSQDGSTAVSVNNDFEGDDARFLINSDVLFGRGSFTVSLWIKETLKNSQNRIVNFGDTNSNIGGMILGTKNSDPPKTRLFTDEGGGNFNQIRVNNLSYDAWHLITQVYDGTTNKAYVDGELLGTEERGYDDTPNSPGISIGNRLDQTTEAFGGEINDLRFYNTGLSDSQVAQIYQNTRPQISASGGSTITTETINGEQYRIHAFENVGTSTFEVSDAQANATADVLVVGGGGAGGQDNGAGGGAGGLVYNDGVSVSQNSYSIQVGTGGDNKRSQAEPNGNLREIGGSGGDSSAFSLTAKGGGGGGCGNTDTPGSDGGSGGGEDGEQNDGFGSGTQPGTNSGVVFDLGNDGGLGGPDKGAGGGGGGATQNGDSGGSNSDAGNGGDGKDMSQFFGTSFGENGIFAGGGAGGVANNAGIPDSNHGNGGLGGGGNHGKSTEYEGEDGQQNTGGGGGGGAYDGSNQQRAGNGGSGIVLIRYKL